MNRIPFRVSRHLPTVRPVGRTDFPEVLGTLQRHLRASPCVGRVVQPRPGSALRLSQPLSGLQQARVPRPCFMPQPVPGLPLLFERSPRSDRVPLSRPLAPSRLSAALQDRATRRTVCPPVSPTPAPLAPLPGSPGRLWLPFPRAEARFPVGLSPTPYAALSGRFTHLGALLPLRIRSRRTRLPEPTADALLATLPETTPDLGTSTRFASHPEGLDPTH
jgi:hypothetical protein